MTSRARDKKSTCTPKHHAKLVANSKASLKWILTLRAMLRASSLVILFASAGSLTWRRGWIFTVAFFFFQAVVFVVTRLRNPQLIEIRLRRVEPTYAFDRTFVLLYGLASVALLIVAGIDGGRRLLQKSEFDWIILAGLLLYAVGTSIQAWAAATNPNLTCTVETQVHQLVTTGPYRIMRHPLYAGRIVALAGWPLILGSPWSYIPVSVIILLFCFRAAHEDRLLRTEISAYRKYCEKTPTRLFPGAW